MPRNVYVCCQDKGNLKKKKKDKIKVWVVKSRLGPSKDVSATSAKISANLTKPHMIVICLLCI